MQSLETKSSRPKSFETEILRDRDSEKQVWDSITDNYRHNAYTLVSYKNIFQGLFTCKVFQYIFKVNFNKPFSVESIAKCFSLCCETFNRMF